MPRLRPKQIVDECDKGGTLHYGCVRGKWRYWIEGKDGALYSASREHAECAIRSKMLRPKLDGLFGNNQTWVSERGKSLDAGR